MAKHVIEQGEGFGVNRGCERSHTRLDSRLRGNDRSGRDDRSGGNDKTLRRSLRMLSDTISPRFDAFALVIRLEKR